MILAQSHVEDFDVDLNAPVTVAYALASNTSGCRLFLWHRRYTCFDGQILANCSHLATERFWMLPIFRITAMRCIFCKMPSAGCISVEHIVPESLGNVDHMLPKGWVCDACNNYFAREVEKPFLDSLYGRSSRFEMAVANKRGRIPSVIGLHPQSRTKIELFRGPDTNELSLAPAEGEDESRWVASVQSNSHGRLYVPAAILPATNISTARFIGKIALEVLAYRCVNIPGWNEEIVDKPELDELRRYVRSGNAKSIWPVRIRRIYPADFLFRDKDIGEYQVLHEWTILAVPESEYYAVISIFGIEYTINLGGPELGGYDRWLKEHGDRSPLYGDVPSD